MQKKSVEIEPLPQVLTVARVAALADVSRRTVREWVRVGRLKASRPSANGSTRLYFETRHVLSVLGIPVVEE